MAQYYYYGAINDQVNLKLQIYVPFLSDPNPCAHCHFKPLAGSGWQHRAQPHHSWQQNPAPPQAFPIREQ